MVGDLLQTYSNSLYSSGTFLNLSKAFDTLNHNVLIRKLESYGVCGLTGDWFKSYLSNHTLTAKISTSANKTTYLKPFPITYRTAQGSCLGPLLFIIFCNDIKLLPLYGTLILFADDTTLLNSHRNKNFLKFSIIHDLELLMDWFDINQLSLNLLKTVIINFWDDGKSDGVCVHGITIPVVENTKFLGIHLDYKITWDKTHRSSTQEINGK